MHSLEEIQRMFPAVLSIERKLTSESFDYSTSDIHASIWEEIRGTNKQVLHFRDSTYIVTIDPEVEK
jgi:hypothetical protein